MSNESLCRVLEFPATQLFLKLMMINQQEPSFKILHDVASCGVSMENMITKLGGRDKFY